MQENIVEILENNMPLTARLIISKNELLTNDQREEFFNKPDSIYEHDINWHQWGILTHSIKTRQSYDTQVKKYLDL